MKIVIISLIISVFLILIWLRMKKYRDELEPNTKIIVYLMNKLKEETKSERRPMSNENCQRVINEPKQ